MNSHVNKDLKDLATLAWVICLFTLSLFFISERQQRAERDFVYFYSVGRIASEHPPDQIYNLNLQLKTFDEVFHLEGTRGYGPSPYPPFIPLLFRSFSRLPFETAFHLWQFFSLALYFCGLTLLARAYFPGQRLAQSLIFAAALSFRPFVAETLASGQLAALGFYAFALALVEAKSKRPFRSGLALSLALYKPTLLLLIVPMLLVRRQWRSLSGLLTGGAVLCSLTTFFLGVQVWTAYIGLLSLLGRLQGLLDFRRYVDVVAFATLLAHGHPLAKHLILLSACLLTLPVLLMTWIRSKNVTLIWTATLTWTLFLNLYVPIYDAVLIVPAAVGSASTLLPRYKRSFTTIMLLLFGCSWAAELVATLLGLPLFTGAVLLFGVLQLRVLHAKPPTQLAIDSADAAHSIPALRPA